MASNKQKTETFKKFTIMKQLVLFLVMCLSSIFAKAQVMTSESINQVYASISTDDKSQFAYNGEYDDNGRMTTMTVYKKKIRLNGEEDLYPVCQYQFEYNSDGLLKNRTKYLWRKDEWRCASRYEYMLSSQLYTITYRPWNKKNAGFDAVAERTEYTLLPDSTICYINYYQRKRNQENLQLVQHLPITYNNINYTDRFLTKK